LTGPLASVSVVTGFLEVSSRNLEDEFRYNFTKNESEIIQLIERKEQEKL
ncbi:9496_t:CDS:2, partial [Dentiscutata erythropus]